MPHNKDIKELFDKKGNNADLLLLDKIHVLEEELENTTNSLSELKKDITREPIEDKKVESIAIRLAAKLSIKADEITPSDRRLLDLIKPLIPIIPIPKDGHTPNAEELLALIKPLIPQVKDGDIPTNDELIKLIKPLIPDLKAPTMGEILENVTLPEEEKVEVTRDKLEALEGNERLKVKIEDVGGLEKDLEELKKRPVGRGGGTSAIGGAQAFKYIAHTEKPSGAINGSNVTYTVLVDIWWIAGFTLNGENIAELPNYTFVNKVITFTTALPAVFAGKDFEIRYIG